MAARREEVKARERENPPSSDDEEVRAEGFGSGFYSSAVNIEAGRVRQEADRLRQLRVNHRQRVLDLQAAEQVEAQDREQVAAEDAEALRGAMERGSQERAGWSMQRVEQQEGISPWVSTDS